MRSNRTWVGGVVFAASLVACGGSGSSTGSDANPDSPGAAATPDAFVAAYCGLYTPCCPKIQRSTDPSRCIQIVGAFMPKSYDAGKANACLGELRASQSKAEDAFCSMNDKGMPTCDALFGKAGAASSGTKNPGDTCAADSDCASSPDGEVSCRASYDSSGSEMRTCQVQIVGKEGDGPCTGTKDGLATVFASLGPEPPRGYVCDTASGLYCPSGTKTCTKVKGVGADCADSSFACDATAYCDFATSKCLAPLPAGAGCANQPDACGKAGYCDGTHVCAARSAAGTSCTDPDQCLSRSCANRVCVSVEAAGDIGLQLICSG